MRFFQVRCWDMWPQTTWTVRAESEEAAVRSVVRSVQATAEKPKPEDMDQDAWDVYQDTRENERNQILAALWVAKVVELAMDEYGILFKDVNCG